MERKIWLDARNNLNSEFVITANQIACFNGVLFSLATFSENTVQFSERMQISVFLQSLDELSEFSQIENKQVMIISNDPAVLNEAKSQGYPTGYYIYIVDQKTMDMSHEIGIHHHLVIAEFKDPTNIPLELIIAKLQSTDVDVLKHVVSSEEAKISFDVMEIGSEGVLLTTDRIEAMFDFKNQFEHKEKQSVEIVNAKVTNIEHIGQGYRSCIDTTNLLTEQEAMIIGSTSSGGLLVCSETHYLPYMDLRPFRVNAGAVHSYVWCPEDTTSYLTDLKVGSQVMVVDIEGNTRTVSVGRVKTEIRPLLLIEAEYENKKINTIVQDDWHIRIFNGKKEPQSATTFKVGDEILAYVCETGRHVGIKIEETIEEK
ncbi:3-dehydroquinate synthase II [Metabacillus malikii]|uniref:3-dehydroquinate synthase II/3-amino-4-hydroxybenzoic acid synthase n=1 Tax=Metabacillus malikii TaxID=1504265 RepID=A0ABT9ZAL7_9BACI|nr:3-dehydroquinate synthase II [Metabacillus malikii]MDQ0229065.1 3-dehydroquinate synthase II/3-amino-4-hydroxybenzoic acid synthase [Metabacillus malikii]